MKKFLATLLAFGFCLIAPSVAIAQNADTSKTLEQLLPFLLLIPISGIIGATICASLAIHARYKQRMLILKTGIKPEEKPYKRERLLIGGASLIAIGGGLLLGLWTKNIGLTIAFVLFFIGIALTLAARFVIKESTPSSQQITQRRGNNEGATT